MMTNHNSTDKYKKYQIWSINNRIWNEWMNECTIAFNYYGIMKCKYSLTGITRAENII